MKAYWDSLTKEQQGELAGKVGSTPGYLRLVFNGYKKASFVLAKKLEQCTSGAITKSDLRPDKWSISVPEHGTVRRAGGLGAVRQPAGEP